MFEHPFSRHSLLYLSHKLILIAVISRAVLLVLTDDELITAHEFSYDLRAKGHFCVHLQDYPELLQQL
jgi:hypothetical protein